MYRVVRSVESVESVRVGNKTSAGARPTVFNWDQGQRERIGGKNRLWSHIRGGRGGEITRVL